MKPASLRFVAYMHRYIRRYPELKYDGTTITCNVCDISFAGLSSVDCKRHVESKTHVRNAKLEVPYAVFLDDLIFTFHACNIPLNVLSNEHFRLFWAKYLPKWPLPTQSTAQRKIPRVREQIKNYIRTDLQDQKLWMTVDEAMDRQNHKVGNVLVRSLTPHQTLKPYLIASKRLEGTTAKAIHELVIGAIERFGLSKNNVLMLVTDGAAYMREAASSLKTCLPNLLHITCLLHTFHCVVDAIRQSYPDVDQLIATTKKVFLKSPLRVKEFRRLCPNIPKPPQPKLTKRGTWLEAAFYYNQHFNDLKSLILTFDSNESSAIGQSQQLFQNPHMQADLQTIHKNYNVLASGILQLQDSSLSLVQAIQIVDSVYTHLQTLTDGRGVLAAQILLDLLNNNPDLDKLRHIKQCICELNCKKELCQYLTYASITSLDVERSFSTYKAIFTDKRTRLKESTVEGMLMIQMYSRCQFALCRAQD